IVVLPLRVAGDHLLEEPLDVREEGGLKLIDEQRTRGVHRPQTDEPLPDVEPPDELHHPAREVDELDALIGLHDEGFAVNRKAADRRRRHVLDGPLAHSDGRTLAHAILFGWWAANARVPRADMNRVMLRTNASPRQPCYTPALGPVGLAAARASGAPPT